MNDQHAAMTILSLEECVDQYIADCRRRVDSFVARHYSVQETLAWQKQSLVTDLLYHPVNALWAIPSLFLKKLLEIPMRLGWRPGADLIGLLPSGFKTRYQQEIERLVASELLEWPLTIADRHGLPHPPPVASSLKRPSRAGRRRWSPRFFCLCQTYIPLSWFVVHAGCVNPEQ
ncbi:MAG: hypothetical protein HP477_11785 [Nitrospira sp.]|nr:hypothetical protein [Nitrospira sp.]